MTRLIIALFLALFASCKHEGEDESAQVVRVALPAEPVSLNPDTATDAISLHVLRMCYEGLTRLGENGPALALAKKIDTHQNGKSYLVTLRSSTWSDGEPITAKTFADSWKKRLLPETMCPFAHELFPIRNAKRAYFGECSIEEVGLYPLSDHVLRIDLEEADPDFLTQLASSAFLPSPSHSNDPQVNNGPYKLTQWHYFRELVLEKNMHYWDQKKVELEKIHFYVIHDQNTELTLFQKGELDWIGHPLSPLPLDALERVKDELHSYPLPMIYSYFFQTEKAPFNDPKIRRAFSLAINRSHMIQHFLTGKERPAYSYLPIKEEPLFEENIEEARAILQEVTLPPITLIYEASSFHAKVAQLVQAEWRENLGVQVGLQPLEGKLYKETLKKGEFQIAASGAFPLKNDPLSLLELFTKEHPTRWKSPIFEETLAKVYESSGKRRAERIRMAEERLIEEMPIIPLYFSEALYLKKSALSGVQLTQYNQIDFKNAHWEKP